MCSSTVVNKSGPFSLSELEVISGAKLYAHHALQSSFLVHGLAPLSEAGETDLSILHQKKYIKALQQSSAGACIVAPDYVDYAPQNMLLLVHKNPYKAFALISQAFYPSEKNDAYIAESAHVSNTAVLGKDCRVEHGAYIGKNVCIGARCKIGVNTFIGDGVTMGDDCQIENNVSISHAIIGNNALVYPGARIGQDGFGFASDEHGHYKIPHRGMVVIGHHVEIGANACIDRGSLKNTIIEDWCRIDNLVQIGHNVKIGRGSILAGQSGVAGSTVLGDFACIGGQAGIGAHLNIGQRVTVVPQGGVIKDVESHSTMGGYPAMPVRDWHKQTITLQRMVKHKNQ